MKKRKNSPIVSGILTFMLLVICSIHATAFGTLVPVSVKFTSEALGLGSGNINDGEDGASVDADFTGRFETSTVTGQGSVLYVQDDGLAGSGSQSSHLFLTVTAKGHLDTPGPGDWNAGILYISQENHSEDKNPSHKNYHIDGYKEGLGVRSFTIDPDTGLRVINPDTQRARIEGSQHVSGGTEMIGTWDDITFDGTKNGSPHVDELIRFDFENPVEAQSIVVRFSEFLSTDVIDLSIDITHQDGSTETLTDNWLGTDESSLVLAGSENDKVYDLIFANIAGLSSTDLVTGIEIRAIDDDPLHPRETAEHFFITGIEANIIPEPATIGLLGIGFLSLFRRFRK